MTRRDGPGGRLVLLWAVVFSAVLAAVVLGGAVAAGGYYWAQARDRERAPQRIKDAWRRAVEEDEKELKPQLEALKKKAAEAERQADEAERRRKEEGAGAPR